MCAGAGPRLRAELAAVDLARGRVGGLFRAENPAIPAPNRIQSFELTAMGYFAIERDFGSPAFTPAELRSQPPAVRQAADFVLARALALGLSPVRILPPTGNPRPRVVAATAAVRPSSPGCRTIRPVGRSPSAQLEVPPRGIALVGANQARTQLALAKFGDPDSVSLEAPQSSRIAVLRIPTDRDPTSWTLLIRGSARPIEACGLAKVADR
jgi:hypothetical protein